MRKIKVISVVFMVFLMSSAQAHGPTRQTSVIKATIAASADEVWEVIKNFDDLSWHPQVANIDNVQGGNKKGATRTMTMTAGGQVTQVLKKYDAKKMLMKFKTPSDQMTEMGTVEFKGQQQPIRVFPAENYLDQIKVERLGENKSKLAWKSSFFRGYTNNLIPGELPELNEEAARSVIQDYVKIGILNVVKKLNLQATEESFESCFSPEPKECDF